MNPFFNEEAEQALLGTLLVNNASYDRVADLIQANHFYHPLHQRLYANIRGRIEKSLSVTPTLLKFGLG